MGMLIVMYGTIGLLAVAWLILLLMNVVRLVRVIGYDGEDAADQRGWVVYGISAASLFMTCCVALVAWVAMEWVLKPLDPFKDTLGTIQLFGMARTNVTFVIITNIVIFILVMAQTFGS